MWSLSRQDKEHIKVIKYVLHEDDIDMRVLRRLALSGGLVTVELRRQAWPKLLGITPRAAPPYYGKESKAQCRDHDQVAKDVNRSLWKQTSGDLCRRRQQLSRLLNWALAEDPKLYYYQGLNDVASVLLLVCGEAAAAPLLQRLMAHHLREFLHERIDGVVQILQLIPPLLRLEDPQVADFLMAADVGDRCHFALSWVLTWFAHPLDGDLPLVCRLFDAFLSTHPLLPMYLSAAIVLHRRKEVLRCPCLFPDVHTLLSKVPTRLPWNQLLLRALTLYRAHPPARLAAMAAVLLPPDSMLVAYPYPYLQQPQHSERYWLLKATPGEMTEPPTPVSSKPARRVARLKQRPRRWYAFVVLSLLAAVVAGSQGPALATRIFSTALRFFLTL